VYFATPPPLPYWFLHRMQKKTTAMIDRGQISFIGNYPCKKNSNPPLPPLSLFLESNKWNTAEAGPLVGQEGKNLHLRLAGVAPL